MERGHPAEELGRKAGLSAAVLTYWADTNLVAPTALDGRYTSTEAAMVLALADAHRLGAPGRVLAAIRDRLAGIPDPLDWPTGLWVTPDGAFHELEPPTEAVWLVHPRDRACDQVSLACAS